MTLTSKLVQLHTEKESLELQARQILTKYGLVLNYWTPKVETEEATKAFFKMCELGINAYPKETESLDATEDYNKWYGLQQDITSILIKMQVVGMTLKGFTVEQINKIFNYKPETNWNDLLNCESI